MCTLERTAENSGFAVTRTDDARQPRDTRGIGYIGFFEEHHLLLMEEELEMDAFYPGVKTWRYVYAGGTKENSGCAVTRTDDARQPRDTWGMGYIGFSKNTICY
ncbi:hypothetical protein CEXT_47731 [Caerostris extrusa]|uniref:Uncharacterized protein n=1 Tax=Caerostris extrusa TaxID=172846 RepID=A0AAV4UPL2_CAEEX|nr:hypothetical protein CEXT_47731 [Caerostris extrusa]